MIYPISYTLRQALDTVTHYSLMDQPSIWPTKRTLESAMTFRVWSLRQCQTLSAGCVTANRALQGAQASGAPMSGFAVVSHRVQRT
jgi:hypothetical protein